MVSDVNPKGTEALVVQQTPHAVMEANGNSILLVDQTEGPLASVLPEPELAVIACRRLANAEVDGVAFMTRRPMRMRFFDRDGTPQSMCGNALRCIARYCHDRGVFAHCGKVLTDDGPKEVWVGPGGVTATVGNARGLRSLPEGVFVYTGVPHLVVATQDVNDLNVVDMGRQLRHDRHVCARVGHPDGVNVNFVAPHPNGLRIRTYEVGVEDETRSCGTGAAAAAYTANVGGTRDFPITMHTEGGELTVDTGPGGLTISGEVLYRRVAAAGAIGAPSAGPASDHAA
jgi:diaminopimelate epimerase